MKKALLLSLFSTSTCAFAQFTEFDKNKDGVVLPGEIPLEKKAAYDQAVAKFEAARLQMEPRYLSSAKAATDALGREFLKGNLSFAIKHMEPRWKKRQEILAGGAQALIKKFRKAEAAVQAKGTVITDFKALQPSYIAYVWMKKKNKNAAVVVYPFDYSFQKLVVVPTEMRVTMSLPKTKLAPAEIVKVVKKSYQVCVYDDTAAKWSFIDGSSIKPRNLRTHYPNLPMVVNKHMKNSGGVTHINGVSQKQPANRR